MKRVLFISVLVLLLNTGLLHANQIDIGIFESATPGMIDIRIRPDFNIVYPQTVTALLYTVRWDDPGITISTQYIYPFFLAPQGAPEEYNGYYYQVFAAVPSNSIPMNASQEYVVSSFTFSNGSCASFEIIVDEWTQANNGNLYLEFIGTDVTGIIYESLCGFGSIGGLVSGNDAIYLGNSTGSMTLTGHQGSVLTWQRKINGNPWTDLPGTAGLTAYSEVPSSLGSYGFRCKVQHLTCPEVFSEVHFIEVLEPVPAQLSLKVYMEGGFVSGEMGTQLNMLGLLPLAHPYSGMPWKYNGTESVPAIPNADVADWLLVELRQTSAGPSGATPATRIARRAGLLLKDGTVTGMDGTNDLLIDIVPGNNIYVVIWHRNHLAVMSSVPMTQVGAVLQYDFTTASGQAYQNGQKSLGAGIYGMYAGNANGDGAINASDKSTWSINAGRKGYYPGDMNLSGILTNQDKNDVWLPNNGTTDKVPD